MNDQDYLVHYGVLGMKWGVRKQRENYLVGRKAQYRMDKADYKRLKGTGASKSQISKAKSKMKASRRLVGIQRAVGKHNKINERYSQKGGRINGAVDTAIFGSARSMNKSMNKGDSYEKAAMKSAAKTIAGTAAGSALVYGGQKILTGVLKKKLGVTL